MDLNNDPNRLNNRWAVPFDVVPADIDLAPVQVSVPTGYVAAFQGNQYIFKAANNGNSAAPAFLCQAWLSADSILSANDYLVVSNNLTCGAHGSSYFYSTIYNAGAPAGIYYLIYKVNVNDSVPETNYTNNQIVSGLVSYYTNSDLYVLPDSVFNGSPYCGMNIHFNGDAAYNPAQQTSTLILQNLNNLYTGLSFTGFALTGNSSLKIYNGNSVDSALIGTYTGNSSPDTVNAPNRALTLQLTGGANSGTFECYYNCDLPGQSTDIYFNSYAISADTLLSGSTFTSNLNIYDQGNYNIDNCTIDYLLSTTGNLGFGAAVTFATDSVNLTANSSTLHSDVVPVIPGLADGFYYMMIVLNKNEAITETNYGNDVASIGVIYKSTAGIEQITPQNPFYYWQDQGDKTIHVMCNNNMPYNSSLYDDLGRKLQEQPDVTGNITYKVLSDGIYFIELIQQGIPYRYKLAVY